MTGLSKTTIWRLVNAQQFPQPIQLSRGTVGWLEREVAQWLEAKAESRPPWDLPVAKAWAVRRIRKAQTSSLENLCRIADDLKLNVDNEAKALVTASKVKEEALRALIMERLLSQLHERETAPAAFDQAAG